MTLAHICHAIGCTSKIDPSLLMCRKHWQKVPLYLKLEVKRNYKKGQEVSKTPTPQYLEAMKAAINAVGKKEGRIDDDTRTNSRVRKTSSSIGGIARFTN